jgi:hypothetical protein
MQLGIARLCLDCDEVHDKERCPACASEAFAFLTRWVRPAPSAKRPAAPKPLEQPPETIEKVEAYRQLVQGEDKTTGTARLLRNGAMLLATIGLARWGWQQSQGRPDDKVRPKSDDGGRPKAEPPPGTGS